jgi:hypothetical protein
LMGLLSQWQLLGKLFSLDIIDIWYQWTKIGYQINLQSGAKGKRFLHR